MEAAHIKEIYDFVLKVTYECGEIVKEGFTAVKDVQTKGHFHDLVTVYDKRVEETLVEKIKAKYPDHKFIGEEDSSEQKTIPQLTTAPTWVIDPIDGTTNYTKQVPYVAISLALVVNKELQIGIVYNPIMNQMYSARKENGAFLNGEPITVSKVEELKKSLLACEISLASLDSVRDIVMEYTRAFVTQCLGLRCFGCAALTLCYVASGVIDGYHVDYLAPWDIAAGALIVREAGGIVIDSSGKPFDIMKPNVIVTGTQRLSQEMLRIVSEVRGRFDKQ